MSYTITTDIFCDICTTNWVHGCTSVVAEKRLAQAAARRQGWVRRWDKAQGRYRDVCPDCVKEKGDD